MSTHGTTTPKAGKVLIINSDPEIIRILEVNLTHANIEVISTQSGTEAVSKVLSEKPDIILLDPALPDIDGIEVGRRIKELPQSSHIPVILITAKAQTKSRTAKMVDIANHNVIKPFDPSEVVSLVQGYLKRKDKAENINSLTGLPNQIQVANEINDLIEQKKTFAAIYIAMDDLRTFNRVYGFVQGDNAIRLLANIVSEAVRLFGNPDDFVGYYGGDKFVVISTPWRARTICRRLIADFNRRIRAMYADEHMQRGYVSFERPLGGEEKSPIIRLLVAVVTNRERTFRHHLEVSEVAEEQMDYLRRFPGSECYLDIQADRIEPETTMPQKGVPYVYREELKAIHGVLSWLDFTIKELSSPIMKIKGCLDSVEGMQVENLGFEFQNSLKIIRGDISKLQQIVEGLALLTKAEGLTAGNIFEEVHIGNTIDWIMEQLQDFLTRQRIDVNIQGTENIGRLLIDRKNLTQGLLYIIRSEVLSCPPESSLHIRVAEENEESVSIRITNPAHHIPEKTLGTLLKGQMEGAQFDAMGNELYPARLMIQGLGGKLNISSDRMKGITYTVLIPRRWQSWMQEIDALRLATEISRREAKAELKTVRHLLSSITEQAPSALKDSLERIGSKIQELGVLCNRSLFLTDDINSRLENQQDCLLQQEAEQRITSEVMVTMLRGIAESKNLENIFDLNSARRVEKYALAVAKEFKLTESEQQALHYAALFKDLGPVLSAQYMVEQKLVSNMEEALAVRERFNNIWNSLSTIPFLSPALVIIAHKYERYNGTRGTLGVRGESIPLGARILAIADAFDSMTSGLSPQGITAPRQAVQKIVDDSGLRFDPGVVNAFLRIWRRKELGLFTSESRS